MGSILISRLVALLAIITLTFLLMKILPGDPFNQEQALPKEIHKALRKHYGLDDPWHLQYVNYLKAVATWNLGPSFRYKDQTVNQIIQQGFPISATLGIEAFFLALSTGLLLGTLAALYHRQWQETLILIFSALGISLPSFLLASLLQYYFALKWGWFPIARWGGFIHTILPALALAALPSAFIARLIRTNLIEVLKQDFIRTARTKGLSETRIILAHALPNALLPVVSYLGPLTANILVGSFIVEKIFAIPGLGQWFVNSVLNRDYTMIMGSTVFYSFILLTTLVLVDIAYTILDPRVRKKVN